MLDLKLSPETLRDLERRYPDKTYDRNKNDPHDFAMYDYRILPSYLARVSGLEDGWDSWEE